MTVRVDWALIKEHCSDLGYPPESLFLFAIPLAGRGLVMAMLNRLEWEATFRVNDYDYQDWDTLQNIVAMLRLGLMGGESVDGIIEQLDRIATAIENAGSPGGALDGITGLLALLDPRLALLLQVADSIDDALGGVFEPPPEE